MCPRRRAVHPPLDRRCVSTAARILAWGSIVLVLSSAVARAGQGPGYRGRPFIEVLEELRAQGLNLVFSSAVVGAGVVVPIEPKAATPRAVLDEILDSLGLEARDGPAGAVLVVRREPAHPTGSLRGRVLSAGRGTPIARASVVVEGTGALATTRPDGTFEIRQIATGVHDLFVEALGYVAVTVTGVDVRPNAPRELVVMLGAPPSFVEEIVVTPSTHSLVQPEQASRLSIDNQDAVLVPTIGGDVSRVIELLPGISGPDNSAAFNVRGSQARDVSLVLDGLELYEPFHLESFQSPFSFIDAKIVDSIDFLGGGFTADLGDRHGGFVELSTALPEGPDRTRIDLGTLNTRVAYGAPTRAGSVLLSARAWYPEAVRDTIPLGETGLAPRFGDAYMKLTFNQSPQMVVSAHGLFAYDHLEFRESDGNETVTADNRTSYLWLRALRSWSPALLSETVASAGRMERTRTGTSEPEDEILVVDDDRTVDFFGLKHDTRWEVSPSSLLKAGIEVRHLDAAYRYATGPEDAIAATRLDPSGTSLGMYLAHRAALAANVAAEVGVRWDRQTYTDDQQFSPRLNAVWRAGERSELRLGLGRFYQSQRIHELLVEHGQTIFPRAELSRHTDLTFQHRLRGGARLRLDAYDRRLSRVHPRFENLFNPLELFPETEMDLVGVAPARARLRGAEILLRTDPSKSFHGWASYAWSSAEDVIDGAGVPRSWDQTHAVKFLVGYLRDRRWSVSLGGTAHTGWPTTPVSGEEITLPDGSTEIEAVRGARNSDRYPAYARIDGKVSRTIQKSRGRLRLELEVVNLTNRANVCCVDDFLFEPRGDGTVRVDRELGHWLGITPSFNVLWEF